MIWCMLEAYLECLVFSHGYGTSWLHGWVRNTLIFDSVYDMVLVIHMFEMVIRGWGKQLMYGGICMRYMHWFLEGLHWFYDTCIYMLMVYGTGSSYDLVHGLIYDWLLIVDVMVSISSQNESVTRFHFLGDSMVIYKILYLFLDSSSVRT